MQLFQVSFVIRTVDVKEECWRKHFFECNLNSSVARDKLHGNVFVYPA